jgi:hypothetical protein
MGPCYLPNLTHIRLVLVPPESAPFQFRSNLWSRISILKSQPDIMQFNLNMLRKYGIRYDKSKINPLSPTAHWLDEWMWRWQQRRGPVPAAGAVHAGRAGGSGSSVTMESLGATRAAGEPHAPLVDTSAWLPCWFPAVAAIGWTDDPSSTIASKVACQGVQRAGVPLSIDHAQSMSMCMDTQACKLIKPFLVSGMLSKVYSDPHDTSYDLHHRR